MLYNHNIYAETLIQTLAGSMVTASVRVSPCKPYLVYSEGRVLLVTFILSDFYNLLYPFSVAFRDLQGKGPYRDL